MTRTIGVNITGTGSYVPTRVVSNAMFTETLDTTDEWIRTRTGISERRFAAPGETSSSLGIIAARDAVAAAGLVPADIDLIVCATITPDLMCPSTACMIQAGLGCRPIPAFDIAAACSGFLYALSVGENFIRSGSARHVLVVGAEILTRIADYSDRNTCILFGDGAGAVVLSASAGGSGLHRIRLYSDGTRQDLIQVPSMVTPNPPPGANSLPDLRYLRMHGREVFKFAVHKMTELVEMAQRDCLELGLPKIDWMVPHQVNRRIIDAALSATGFPPDRVVLNLDRYGNTSAASVPIALDEATRDGRCQPGDTLLMVAFGGGLTWSSAIVTVGASGVRRRAA